MATDLRLVAAPPRYDPVHEQNRNADLERADRNNVKRWDLETALAGVSTSGGSGNLDGGTPSSVYGGVDPIDGGTA